ncbi:unnamed protein product [Mesocestoides corti]|nr:unnamed protein product [Mesocestoides corti]
MQLLCDGTISGYGVVYAGFTNDSHFLKANYTEHQLALPGAIQSCLYITAMGLASPLVNLLGFQWVACAGGLLAGLAMTVASFFDNITWIVVFYGFFSGLGLGAVCICAVVSVTYYFEKYRGIASGIAASGNGLGYILVPLLLNFLTGDQGEDGVWRHAVLIYSLVVAGVIFTLALMLRPIEIEAPTLQEILDIEEMLIVSSQTTLHQSSSKAPKTTKSALEPIKESETLIVKPERSPPGEQETASTEIFASAPTILGGQLSHEQRLQFSRLWNRPTVGEGSFPASDGDVEQTLLTKPSTSVTNGDKNGPSIHTSNPDGLGHFRLQPSYLHSKVSTTSAVAKPLSRPDGFFLSSLKSLRNLDRSISVVQMDVNTQLQLLEKQATFSDICPTIVASPDDAIRSSESLGPVSSKGMDKVSFKQRLVRMLDLSLFCNYAFLVLAASFTFCQLAYFVPFVYFFSFVLESGLSRGSAMLLITILGILHTFGRLFGGASANIPKVDIVLIASASCLLCAACHLALPFLPTYFSVLAVYSASFGFLCGVPCPTQPLLFVRFLGLGRLTMAFGYASILKGLAAAVGPIIAAYVKDATGSLHGVFYWCGGCFAMSGLLLFLVYIPITGVKNGGCHRRARKSHDG